MNKTIIKPFEEINLKVYGYTLPEVPNHDGYVKIGDTTRDAVRRVFEQVGTAGLNPNIIFEKLAKKSDGKWFRDKELHSFLQLNGIQKKDFNGKADEWFYFKDEIDKAEELTDKFINKDYDEIQISKEHQDYKLRYEQQQAVEETNDYYTSSQEPREFLWNAKPRFGKTLTSYDFIRRIKAQNVLIVTNRPAIANSWFDDFHKFIAWQETGMKFISETDALKDKAMSRHQFVEYAENSTCANISQIAFISLQDLKGAKFAGGIHEKLEWVRDLKWDLLIVDEAHEGVDTIKTDAAFDKINRGFTLHLSGTPFKALANNKFSERQLFNWSYTDEQEAKKNWDEILGSNPYENLPTLNLFTYQMSKMIEEEISKGVTLEDNHNVDYAFDLNEFFKVKDNGSFEYEDSVIRFLDNLSSGKFPYATDQYQKELKHTFWLLPRVNSAKAMEKLLRSHTVFCNYKVILAAGDGVILHESLEEEALDYKENEKSFNRVKNAIVLNERTITLSVGQLTTGVTIPEWTAVIMLNNIKSPSLYFQAAFRAQNPYEYEENGKLFRKENSYIFDFSPDRTLLLYDEFANNLSSEGNGNIEERKKRIKKLLNFFPVIAEDEQGQMHEIDVNEVLAIPTRITSTEVVKRGFMSNLLFANIAGIFSGDSPFKAILDKMKPEKNKRLGDRREVNVTNPMLNKDGEVKIPKEVIINESKDLFGDKIYKFIEDSLIITKAIENNSEVVKKVAGSITSTLGDGLNKLQEKYDLKKSKIHDVNEGIKETIEEAVEANIKDYAVQIAEINEEFQRVYEEALKSNNNEVILEVKGRYEVKRNETEATLKGKIVEDVKEIVESVVGEQIEAVEEQKKKTTEDDVRDHLRGFARTIPAFLMAYGNEETKLSNFERNINAETFEELTSITIDEFKKLRDGFTYLDEDGNENSIPGLFNEIVFNASVTEFFRTKQRLANYFDETLTEDIFDYIPPQKTNQIFTPRWVVKLMVDNLEKENPEIFSNSKLKFIDLYTKSGLYMSEIVKRLSRGLEGEIPDAQERLKWILENQVFGCAPSDIIYNIAKNYVFSDFDGITTKNLVRCDLSNSFGNNRFKNKIREVFGDNKMKFDVIIGNPPYQEEAKGTSTSDDPIYHLFMEESYKIASIVTYITPARFLFNAGKTPKKWNREMLNDPHVKVTYYNQKSSAVFPNTDIKGGVAVTYRNSNENYEPIGIFTVNTELKSILNKTINKSLSFVSLSSIVHTQNNFNLNKLYADFPEYKKIIGSNGRDRRLDKPVFSRISILTEFEIEELSYKIIGRYENKRVWRFIPRKYIEDHPNLKKWKVVLPVSNGSGKLGEALSSPFVCQPFCGYTRSFISIGSYESMAEAEAVLKYIKTKFARILLGVLKVTQDNTTEKWAMIPIQDFSSNSDISWEESIHDIDEQLFKKYNLSSEEINFINETSEQME